MNTKLTLSLDSDVIDKAKLFAKNNNVSLSFLIENLLLKVVSEYSEPEKASLTDELSGIINLSNDFDSKEVLSNHFLEKYK